MPVTSREMYLATAYSVYAHKYPDDTPDETARRAALAADAMELAQREERLTGLTYESRDHMRTASILKMHERWHVFVRNRFTTLWQGDFAEFGMALITAQDWTDTLCPPDRDSANTK